MKNLETGKTVVEWTDPLKFDKESTTISLRASKDEYFYGGGVQNGRFSHKGKAIVIENTNNWVDGGVASPTPFYWSTGGYGLMWHTFRPGRYDFGATEDGKVLLSHKENYLDVFFMINDGAVPLLNDFYQLTGNPVLLPKFGFYMGHLNAYNRDYWKEAENGFMLYEDGKRYNESQKPVEGGLRESLNGEDPAAYQFSARAAIDRYQSQDMPLGWFLPNDGYACGYGQGSSLDENIQNLKEFGDYAHSKGVRLMMHHETSSSVDNYERHLDQALCLMDKYGYNAIKTGYVGRILPKGEHHYSQSIVNHYQHVVDEAAKHKVMINGHEAVRPTGLCRTYPNLVGNESATGTEHQAFGGIRPGHVTVLPFTRLNGGPMDYTPGIFVMDIASFTDGNNTSWVNSTIAGQLALYVTLYSPLQMAADFPEHYEKFMDAFQFIKDVDLDWVQSRYLLAEPGDYVVIARQGKKDGQWFCGGVTDEQKRTLAVPMDFLEAGKVYEATIYADAHDADYKENPQAYEISAREVTSEDVLQMTMARGGGFAISFEEKR